MSLDKIKQFHKAFGIKDKEEPEAFNFTWFEFQHIEETSRKLYEIAEELKQLATKHKNYPVFIRLQLMTEELAEVCEAIGNEQPAEILKELCDLEYTVLGTLLNLGYSSVYETAFNRVHESNMSKLDKDGSPIIGDNGRVLKSMYYKPAYLGDLWT